MPRASRISGRGSPPSVSRSSRSRPYSAALRTPPGNSPPAKEPARPSRDRGRHIVDAWLAAAQDGDVGALLSLLDDGAVLHADYGTSSEVVSGARSIAERAVLSGRLAAHSTPILIGGRPGVAAVMRGRVVSIMAFEIEVDRIARLDVLADPVRIEALGVQESVRAGRE
jgi:RNA polymerase sigma-70 factor (ECF subfamily)